MLIVPAPMTRSHACYAHLARFLRGAPAAQVRAFWSVVGQAALRRMGTIPFWLSTAGLGVAWLHIRLDSRPKYYRYAAYRQSGNRV